MPGTNYCMFGNTIKGDQNDDGNANLQMGGCDTSIQIYTGSVFVVELKFVVTTIHKIHNMHTLLLQDNENFIQTR